MYKISESNKRRYQSPELDIIDMHMGSSFMDEFQFSGETEGEAAKRAALLLEEYYFEDEEDEESEDEDDYRLW